MKMVIKKNCFQSVKENHLLSLDMKLIVILGFVIYKLKEENVPGDRLDKDFFKYNKSVGRSRTFSNIREVSGRFQLPPGEYVIIPSTFKPDLDGRFLLRVFTEKRRC